MSQITTITTGNQFIVAVQGIAEIEEIRKLGPQIARKAMLAINKTLAHARKISSDEMRGQINFPASYLTGSQGRLEVRKAGPGYPSGKIVGRFRPTSLSRIVKGNPRVGKPGLTFEVEPGKRTSIPGAFLMKLKVGAEMPTENKFNMGVAIKLPEGKRIHNKTTNSSLYAWKGLHFLYGPSVDQVFRQVSSDVAKPAGDFLEKEFRRLVGVDLP